MNILKPLAIFAQLLFCIEAKADYLDINILTISLAGISSGNPHADQKPKPYLDAIYQLIEQNYEGNITYKETPPNRIAQELLKSEKTQCLINVKNKAFDKLSAFISVAPAINPRIIYDPLKLKAIPQTDGLVDIKKLITEKKYVGGIVKGRPYTDSLAPYIEKGIANQTIQEISSSTFGTNLVGMLASERVDYIIDYPATLHAYTGPGDTQALIGAVIYQGKDISEIGFYCSKTAESALVNKHLNQAVIKMLQNNLESYLKIGTDFDAGPQRLEFAQKLNEYVLNRLK